MIKRPRKTVLWYEERMQLTWRHYLCGFIAAWIRMLCLLALFCIPLALLIIGTVAWIWIQSYLAN